MNTIILDALNDLAILAIKQNRDVAISKVDIVKKYILELENQKSRRNMQIRELKKQLNSLEVVKANHHFTAEEIEVMRDILVTTGQDKFRGSYPLMSSVCSKIGEMWHEFCYKPNHPLF